MELTLTNLSKRYGDKTALSLPSLTFREGICGLLGENGAGKSTLMNLITDNIRRTSGEILFNGTDILKLGKDFRRLVGFMPQQPGFYEGFSGRQFLLYMAELKRIPAKAARAQAEDLLALVNLTEDAHRGIGGYSGGMRQRLMLASALLGNPSILLLDEPTAGLDPKERIRIRRHIRELGKNRIVILATHIVSDVETIADRILLMQAGKIIKDGTPEDLMNEIAPRITETVTGRLSLEDVYLYYLGG